MSGNWDVQATHHILDLLERANTNNEEALDVFPAIYCVISADGTIFRANRMLAGIFNLHPELVLNQTLKSLFSLNEWQVFNQKLEAALSSFGGRKTYEFECDMSGTGIKKNYVWYMVPFGHSFRQRSPLVTVIGCDVSQLKAVTVKKERMELELETAKALQETLLPPTDSDFGTVQISGAYISASECCGDFWFYRKLGNELLLCIGDVTGHGVGAALLSSAARALMSVDELMQASTPSQILGHLNKTICDLAKSRTGMTASVCKLNLDTYELKYANAAHEPVIIIPHGKRVTPKDLKSFILPSSLLGVNPSETFPELSINLKSGDRIFFYTDGLLDVTSEVSGQMNQRRVFNTMVRALHSATTPRDVINKLVTWVKPTDVADLVDDVTFFIAQMT